MTQDEKSEIDKASTLLDGLEKKVTILENGKRHRFDRLKSSISDYFSNAISSKNWKESLRFMDNHFPQVLLSGLTTAIIAGGIMVYSFGNMSDTKISGYLSSPAAISADINQHVQKNATKTATIDKVTEKESQKTVVVQDKKSYKVKKGDSLWKIASQYTENVGAVINDFCTANGKDKFSHEYVKKDGSPNIDWKKPNKRNPNYIRVGDVIDVSVLLQKKENPVKASNKNTESQGAYKTAYTYKDASELSNEISFNNARIGYFSADRSFLSNPKTIFLDKQQLNTKMHKRDNNYEFFISDIFKIERADHAFLR